MNCLRRFVLTSNIVKRNVYSGSCLSSMKNPCPPPPTNQEFQKTIVRPQFKRLKENQKKFQVDDGLPVWLKGGTRDKILYQITLVGLFICLAMSGHLLFTLVTK